MSVWEGSFYSIKFGRTLIRGTIKVSSTQSVFQLGTSIDLQLVLDIHSIISPLKHVDTAMIGHLNLSSKGKRVLSGQTELPGQRKLTISLFELDENHWEGDYQIHQPILPSDHGSMSILKK